MSSNYYFENVNIELSEKLVMEIIHQVIDQEDEYGHRDNGQYPLFIFLA
ncbi:hypothetical protein [Mucilaginibacter flavidus]|nr:hypothetical protein [Mucilaginibacter flavidus]MCO5951181.1 hypothetical protein [Mucilaginibacter flavidus]